MSMQIKMVINVFGGNWPYIVSNHKNLSNFTAATYFVYALQVNSSCSTLDPEIQFLNGDIGKCSPRFHRAVTAVYDAYVANLVHHRLYRKKDHPRKLTVPLNRQFLGSYISPTVTSKIYIKESVLASDLISNDFDTGPCN